MEIIERSGVLNISRDRLKPRRCAAIVTALCLFPWSLGAVDLTDEYLKANITPAYSEGGKYFTEEDIPTYNVSEDGKLDWPSYSGFRRYHSECHVCHGPEGEGSSLAPVLKQSALDLDYYEFVDVVVNGREKVDAAQQSVMPAFGVNANVMCYLDDIYVYLKGRGMDAIPRGRPADREEKSDEIREAENSCLGQD